MACIGVHIRKGETVGKNLYGGDKRRSYYLSRMWQGPTIAVESHLELHGLTPDIYRQKWGISPHIPLTSHRLAQRCYQLANHLERYDQNMFGEEDEMGDFFHELAEALTVIQGQVHLAQKSLSSYMRPREYLDAIQHTVMRIGQRMQDDSLTL